MGPRFKAYLFLLLPQTPIEYQFQSEFTWVPDVIQESISYPEYVMETAAINYVETFQSNAGHRWRLGVHLEGLTSSLDSGWIEELTREPIDAYSGLPADNCEVKT